MTIEDDQADKAIEQRRQASRKHGAYAFEARGEAALTEQQRAYYMELRERFRTEPGRREYREEMATALAMICELGFSHLRRIAEDDRADLWQSDVIKRLATYANTLVRVLDNWPPEEEKRMDITDILRGSDGKD